MHYVFINITGPYGRGISSISYDMSITNGEISLDSVAIYHYGIYGGGIHLDVLTGSTRDASLAKERIQLTDIKFKHTNIYPNYNLTTSFAGINITVRGDIEGGEITLSHVHVNSYLNRARREMISVALLDTVSHFNVTLNMTYVVQECENFHGSENRTFSFLKIDKQLFSNITEGTANSSITHSSIKIELRGNSRRNRIYLETVDAYVSECSIPGSSLSIEATDQSEENVVLVHSVFLERGNSRPVVQRRGLQVIITGWARRNSIHLNELKSFFHRDICGAGG